eukprot:4968653-Amphidinium_carterae.1
MFKEDPLQAIFNTVACKCVTIPTWLIILRHVLPGFQEGNNLGNLIFHFADVTWTSVTAKQGNEASILSWQESLPHSVKVV